MPGPGKGRNQKAFEKPKNVRATVAFLWKYISRHKGVLLLAIVLTILNVLASLYTTSLMQPIIDNYLHPADSSVTLNERTLGLRRHRNSCLLSDRGHLRLSAIAHSGAFQPEHYQQHPQRSV